VVAEDARDQAHEAARVGDEARVAVLLVHDPVARALAVHVDRDEERQALGLRERERLVEVALPEDLVLVGTRSVSIRAFAGRKRRARLEPGAPRGGSPTREQQERERGERRGPGLHGIPPSRMRASLSASMLPPETTQTTRPLPALPVSAAASAAPPAP